MTTLLKNDNVHVYTLQDSIVYKDLTDHYNETTGYTRGKRGLAKAQAFMVHLSQCPDLLPWLTFRDITNVLDDKFNLKTRSYCAMD